MFGKIVYINDNLAHVEVQNGVPVNEDLMNMHVIFEDEKKKILGEVADITKELIKIRFLGEIVNGKFIGGVIRKPNLSSVIRVITKEEFKLITGENNESSMMLGMSPLYDDCPIFVNVNDLFSNHMAIFGNTGSGKSWGLARLLQNVFENQNIVPFRSNFLIFDAYGEYHTAFKEINKINPNFNFKYFTTNVNDKEGTLLKMPIFLFNVDDLALFLNATEHSQLPIIEKALTKLEYDKIIEKLAEKAASEAGKEKCRKLEPSTNIFEIDRLQQETDEAFRYLVIKNTPSFGGLHDIRGAVNRTAIGAILSMKELLDIADSLYVVQKIKAYGKRENNLIGILAFLFE